MKLKEIYSQNKTNISFEVFPPKDDIDGDKFNKLFDEINIVKKYKPALISVTYGAGGSNKDKSYDIYEFIR